MEDLLKVSLDGVDISDTEPAAAQPAQAPPTKEQLRSECANLGLLTFGHSEVLAERLARHHRGEADERVPVVDFAPKFDAPKPPGGYAPALDRLPHHLLAFLLDKCETGSLFALLTVSKYIHYDAVTVLLKRAAEMFKSEKVTVMALSFHESLLANPKFPEGQKSGVKLYADDHRQFGMLKKSGDRIGAATFLVNLVLSRYDSVNAYGTERVQNLSKHRLALKEKELLLTQAPQRFAVVNRALAEAGFEQLPYFEVHEDGSVPWLNGNAKRLFCECFFPGMEFRLVELAAGKRLSINLASLKRKPQIAAIVNLVLGMGMNSANLTRFIGFAQHLHFCGTEEIHVRGGPTVSLEEVERFISTLKGALDPYDREEPGHWMAVIHWGSWTIEWVLKEDPDGRVMLLDHYQHYCSGCVALYFDKVSK